MEQRRRHGRVTSRRCGRPGRGSCFQLRQDAIWLLDVAPNTPPIALVVELLTDRVSRSMVAATVLFVENLR